MMGWIPTKPLTTKGDIHGYDTADARIPVGTDDQVLTADSGEGLGVKWAAAGGGSGAGGQAYLTGFGEDNLAANLTNSQLYRNTQGVETQIPTVTTHSGDIVGIAVASSEARSAGTATFEVFKNGTGTGLTTVLDGTDTQYASASQALGLDTFVAGNQLDIRVTTDGSWAPTTAEVEAVIVIESNSTVPDWVARLATPTTVGTDDDEFNDGSIAGAWTSLLVSGSATWTEDDDVLSVVFDSQTSGDAAAQIKSINGSPSSPIEIYSIVRGMTTENHCIAGLFFSDGTTASSNVVVGYFNFIASPAFALTQGTFTDIQNSVLWSATLTSAGVPPLVYLRFTWVSANTWRLEGSPDGVSWTVFGNSDQSDTMTPTHYGVLVSSFGGTVDKIVAFETFRSDAP